MQLSDSQVEVLTRAVDHYGRRAQLRKVAEELRELAAECDLAALGRGSAERMALERADVHVMLWQFDKLLLPSLMPMVPSRIASQIKRLERRLENGED